MRNDKFEHDEHQIYFILFLLFLIFLVFLVAVNFWWIKAPNLDTKEGRCVAFCAGIGKIVIGRGSSDDIPLTCYCDYPPTPIDKRMLRRP